MRYACFLALVILLSGCGTVLYDANYSLDPYYVLDTAGIDEDSYIKGLKEGMANITNEWALGDNYLVLARMANKSSYYYDACYHFGLYNTKEHEKKALLYETMASLNCSGKSMEYYKKAINEWLFLNVSWRAGLLKGIVFGNAEMQFETSKIKPKLNLSGYSKIIIGSTRIEADNNTVIGTQVDRVYRDWLGEQIMQEPFSGEFLSVFSERLSYNESELREDIGWHEGGRAKELEKIGIMPITLPGTVAARKDGRWYAPDENGVFSFEIPPDKINYPTTRFFAEDAAMIIDTHGVNMLAEHALRKKVDIIISDCDHEGKVKAALYLSEKGIKVVCFPDRFVYLALGHNANILGSPVWRVENGKMVYGDAPLTLNKGDKVVASMVSDYSNYGLMYYDAPYNYFTEINRTFPLNIISVGIDDFKQLGRVFDKARENNASIAAVRIFNSDDYNAAKEWLNENEENKIILFHSTMYPYGILLMNEFKGRVSFDEPNVVGMV